MRFSAEHLPADPASSQPARVCLRDTEGDKLTVTITPSLGCDISSLTYGGKELLHRGGDFSPPTAGSWVGKAPLLFPAVGRQAGATYADEATGVVRGMPTHGFGSELPFLLSCLSGDDFGASATFTVTYRDVSGAAAAAFPYPWRLVIRADVAGNQLQLTHTIDNIGPPDGPRFPVAIGNHITLRFPFDGTGLAIWKQGRIRSSAARELVLTPGSLLSGEVTPRPEFASCEGLPLSDPLATNGVVADAPAGTGAASCESVSWMTVSQPGALAVRVRHACSDDSVPRRFVLWGESPANDFVPGFICPEPWLTDGPDSLNFPSSKGTPVLCPGQSIVWTMTVDVTQDTLRPEARSP